MRHIFAGAGALILSACASVQTPPAQLPRDIALPLPVRQWTRCDVVFDNGASGPGQRYAQFLNVPVADSPTKQQRGLSGNLSQGEPLMLFNWADSRRRPFWMNGTTIPLTVAYIDRDGTVTQIGAMEPETNIFHWSDKPVSAALEAPPALFQRFGLHVGSQMQVQSCNAPLTYGPLRAGRWQKG